MFSNHFSAKGFKKILLDKEIFILLGWNLIILKLKCKNKKISFYSISVIRLMYKFIISYIKINKIDFWYFLKCRTSSHGFNKLAIKSNMHAK